MQIKLDTSTGHLVIDHLPPVTLAHHLACSFLQALVQAMHSGKSISTKDVAAIWQRSDRKLSLATRSQLRGELDRTAMSRLVAAVESALNLLPPGAAHLEYWPRHKTVGPWSLKCDAGIQWVLVNAPEPDDFLNLDLLPRLAASTLTDVPAVPSEDMYRTAQALVLAKDELQRGQCVAAVQYLTDALDQLELAEHGKALVTLRLFTPLQREGRFGEAYQALEQAALLAEHCGGPTGAGLRTECALLAARSRFNQARNTASETMNFGDLWRVAQSSPDAKALGQWASLYVLVMWRALTAQNRAGADLTTLNHTHVRILRLFEAAVFWLIQGGDVYQLQAVAINLATYLCRVHEWLDDSPGQADFMRQGLLWYGFGCMLVDRFDLPQDCAWDFILVGAVYLNNAQGRQILEQSPMIWPFGNSPKDQAFYTTSLQLARDFGDAQQKIFALDQLAQWQHQSGEFTASLKTMRERDEILEEDKHLADELYADGYKPFCAS